jgi:hypothetical protein
MKQTIILVNIEFGEYNGTDTQLPGNLVISATKQRSAPQSALLSMSGHSALPSSKVGTFEAKRSLDHSKFQETYVLSFHIREM